MPPKATPKVDELNLKKVILNNKLHRFEIYLNDVLEKNNKDEIFELSVRCDSIFPLKNEFEDLQTQLDILLGDSDNTAYTDFESLYFKVISLAQKFLTEQSQKVTTDTQGQGSRPRSPQQDDLSEVNLGKINLPTFYGSYSEWLSFSDTFKALVHDNSKIREVNKFYHLKSCLKGEAAQLIQSLSATNDNYLVAWKLLQDRYENKKLIINTHIKAIFDLNTLKEESHIHLRSLLDNFNKNLRCLTNLKLPTDQWDTLLIFILASKLDFTTKREWENQMNDTLAPTLQQLVDFLTKRCQFLETVDTKQKAPFKPTNPRAQSVSHLNTNIKRVCAFCKGAHFNFECDKIIKMSNSELYNQVRKNNLCINCLRPGHSAMLCKSNCCKHCGKKHFHLLHLDISARTQQMPPPLQPRPASEQVSKQNENTIGDDTLESAGLACHTQLSLEKGQTLLATVSVNVLDRCGNAVKARALLDNGSMACFMTKDFAKKLNLKTTKIQMPISGLNGATNKVTSKLQATFLSLNDNYKQSETFLLVDRVSENLPLYSFDLNRLQIPKNIQLADPDLCYSKPIDLLLNATIFYEILCVGQIRLGKNLPVLHKTRLGWILSGDFTYQSLDASNEHTGCNLNITNTVLHEQVERFWKLEEIQVQQKVMSKEEVLAEQHFKDNFTRNKEGRCQVSLPKKKTIVDLSNSQDIAIKRFLSLEKKLQIDKKLHEEYTKFMTEFETLELLGALLLSRLIIKCTEALSVDTNNKFYWSDSTIVLSWIAGEPNTWQTFVANRVTEIHQLTDKGSWRFVKSEQNAADILSRGTTPQQLQGSKIWWHGPDFLVKDEQSWPVQIFNTPSIDLLEQRKNSSLNFLLTPEPSDNRNKKLYCDDSIFYLYSSYTKLVRVLAWILRFLHNFNQNNKIKLAGKLTTNVIKNSPKILIKLAQCRFCHSDITSILRDGQVSSSSKLHSLTPIIDMDGILRVGGRLKWVKKITFDKKHPVILPLNHPFTDMIIYNEHVRHLHAGTQATLSALRHRFWILNGKTSVGRIIRKCITCYRVKPSLNTPLMGNLPDVRVTPARPFLNIGCDFAGPILVKDGSLRTKTFVKTYISIFVCLVTRAVHIELAGDLSTACFMNCLKRFVSRRGLPQNIYTDNGKNFIGSNNELGKLFRVLKVNAKSVEMENYLSGNQIVWHFIPPLSPHMGGIWEAAVKSAKFHLVRILGETRLTYEHLYTILCQIESILNSRPMTPLSNDPNDYLPLTPSHFLIGDVLTAISERDYQDVKENRLTRYERLQKIVQHFWRRWSSDYLTSLQQKSKWRLNDPNNPKIGDLVLLHEENLPPQLWKLGRIAELHPGKDDIIRVVTVKTINGLLKRSVVKISVLPID